MTSPQHSDCTPGAHREALRRSNNRPRMHPARVRSCQELTKNIFSVWVEAQELAATIQPGQFVQVKSWPGVNPLLRRPLSVAQTRGDQLRFVFRVTGVGTELLSKARPGDSWSLLGPLGQGIAHLKHRDILLVGGGIGIAPLLFVAQRTYAHNAIAALLGARRRAELILVSEFRTIIPKVLTATDDGSIGQRGPVTTVLATVLRARNSVSGPGPIVIACGPRPMLRRVKELCPELEAYAFWEERMGCGTGICYGCAVRSADHSRYIRICQEGPVLDIHQLEI